MALLAQSFRATLPQTNNQLRTSSNTQNQATNQYGRVVLQNVQGQQNQNQRNCAQPKRLQNSDYFKDKILLMQAQENGAVLDEEELLFLAGEQGNTFDADVDNSKVKTLDLKGGITLFKEMNVTLAKKAQPALYDGDELLKPHYVPVIVSTSEEELELAEATRNKLHVENDDSIRVEYRVNFMPSILLKRKFSLATLPSGLNGNTEAKHFEGIQKSLVTEVRAMKAVFENLEAEVDQNETDLRSGEIERKNLLITNENLVAECLSKDVFYTATDSVLNVSRFSDLHDAFTSAQKRIADLESENFNLRNKIQHDDHDSMIKHFSKLEVEHFNLQLKYQNLKERFGNKKPVTSSDAPSFDSLFVIGKLNEQIQSRGNMIRELKEKISRLTKKNSDTDPTFDLKALVSQNKDLTAKLNALHDLNECFRAENAKVKQHVGILDLDSTRV
ncbi:hypothetical protein Tco_0299983 [Tanacetum coccineum]